MLYHGDKLYVHDGANGDIRVFDATTGADEGFLVQNDPGLTDRAWGMVVIPEPSTVLLLIGGLLALAFGSVRRKA